MNSSRRPTALEVSGRVQRSTDDFQAEAYITPNVPSKATSGKSYRRNYAVVPHMAGRGDAGNGCGRHAELTAQQERNEALPWALTDARILYRVMLADRRFASPLRGSRASEIARTGDEDREASERSGERGGAMIRDSRSSASHQAALENSWHSPPRLLMNGPAPCALRSAASSATYLLRWRAPAANA